MSTHDLPTPNVVLDLKGVRCPGPLVSAKRMVNDLEEGQTLLLVSDCPGTQADLFSWARITGNQILGTERRADGGHGYYIRKGPTNCPQPNAVLDTRGTVCPGPIVEAHRLLHGMQSGEILNLVSDCPGVEGDIRGWADTTGIELMFVAEIDPGQFEFYLRKR